jgi:hypothetical protein
VTLKSSIFVILSFFFPALAQDITTDTLLAGVLRAVIITGRGNQPPDRANALWWKLENRQGCITLRMEEGWVVSAGVAWVVIRKRACPDSGE